MKCLLWFSGHCVWLRTQRLACESQAEHAWHRHAHLDARKPNRSPSRSRVQIVCVCVCVSVQGRVSMRVCVFVQCVCSSVRACNRCYSYLGVGHCANTPLPFISHLFDIVSRRFRHETSRCAEHRCTLWSQIINEVKLLDSSVVRGVSMVRKSLLEHRLSSTPAPCLREVFDRPLCVNCWTLETLVSKRPMALLREYIIFV